MDVYSLLETEKPGIWSEVIELNRGDMLIKGGEIESHIYFVKSGALRAFVLTDDLENTIRLGYQGNIINALPSFLSGKPSEIYIEALKHSNVQKAHKTDILNLIKNSPKFQEIWRKLLEQLFLDQFEREVDLLHPQPEQRYARVFSRSPQLFQHIPSKYIADYLRMTPETLSRLKKS
jgi:CRP-like cAMP-binding protein